MKVGTTAMNPNEKHRQDMQRLCEKLTALCGGLLQTFGITGHIQVIAEIQRKAQSVPDDKLPEVQQELEDVIRRLKNTSVGDGEAIISADRWKEYVDRTD